MNKDIGFTAYAGLIDHTLLRPDAVGKDIMKLCLEAKKNGFYSVCVNPCHVRACKKYLKGSSVKVCAVAGFPLGASTVEAKAFEAKEASAAGADEIDLVINIGALLSGGSDYILKELKQVRLATRGRVLKVIIEAPLLTKKEIALACLIAKKAGADFVKTSTGFAGRAATAEDVKLMRKTVGYGMGVKAAGGIKDADTFIKMLNAGASRIGASSSVNIIRALSEKSR